MKNKFISGIITAAGNSSRMGTDKIFLQLGAKPAIYYTLVAFEKAQTIDEVVVVCKSEHQEELQNLIKENNIKKVYRITKGAATRQGSVFSGVKACSSKTTHFVIHDAARCLITPEEIDNVIFDAMTHKACTLGVPCKDTIKVINGEGFVVNTPVRSTLWAIQTPQVFEKELYLKAMNSALLSHKDYTDDCQLVENISEQVYVVRGNYSNLKLTTPDDVAIFENSLKIRTEKQ